MDKQDRSFTIISINKLNGTKVKYDGCRFISTTPSASAQKAFTKAYHHLKGKGSMSLNIEMKETTQGSLNKTYKYRVTKKSEVVEVERDGVLVTYNFTTKIRAI